MLKHQFSVEQCWYLDGWLLGDTRYGKLGCGGDVIDTGLKLEIGEPNLVHYICLRANSFAKRMNSHLLSPAVGNQ